MVPTKEVRLIDSLNGKAYAYRYRNLDSSYKYAYKAYRQVNLCLLYTSSNTIQRLLQKPIEWVIAVKLERYYTKEEILTMYLNKFDFLNNAVGIKTAASTYFGCEPKDLKIEQAAMLVGMCQNPSRYNPVSRNAKIRENALGRRNVVLLSLIHICRLRHQ